MDLELLNRLAEKTWNQYYHRDRDRRSWDKLEEEARQEWIEVFSLFVEELTKDSINRVNGIVSETLNYTVNGLGREF